MRATVVRTSALPIFASASAGSLLAHHEAHSRACVRAHEVRREHQRRPSLERRAELGEPRGADG